jgi:polysaccharide pyruvyl transferase WcaK-like protein
MTDAFLEAWVSALIERTKLRWMLGGGVRWKPGQPLKLLLVGYNGARNTGSDVRVEEIARQVRHVLGAERVEITAMSQNLDWTRDYFKGSRQVYLPDVFPPFLSREIKKYHGVLACEGSTFKSKFADALTTMFIGALGIAAAQNKLSLGYGVEAGAMNPPLQKMVRKYCQSSFIITRNPESQAVLGQLGVPTELGTDTAWTFEPLGAEYGRQTLERAGWDGKTPVLVVCPINPFWWPVRPSILKYGARVTTGAFKESHYRTLYFHKSGRTVDAKYRKYIDEMTAAVKAFRERRKVFPILVAMERLDARACHAMAEQLPGVPVFTSDEYNMFQLVSVLRQGSLMVSSRFHAIVTSMPGLVASAGVTMDERIRNLMHERGHEHLLFTVEEEGLSDKLIVAMETLLRDSESLRDGIGRTVARSLKLMARMGVYLEQQTNLVYPEFPVRSGIHAWDEYLPPLSPGLRSLIEKYDSPDEQAGSTMLVGNPKAIPPTGEHVKRSERPQASSA